MQVKIKDFMIIQDLEIEFLKGLNVVRGSSGNGKSTILRAIKTFLTNVVPDSPFRHGETEFAISICLNNQQIVYGRDNQGAYYIINDKVYRRLGKDSLFSLVKDYKIAYYNFEGDKFYPNFVFQQEIPVFDQIDIYKFFSSMYNFLNIINSKFQNVKNDLNENKEKIKELKSKIDFYSSEMLVIENKIKDVDEEKLRYKVETADLFDKYTENIQKLELQEQQLREKLKFFEKYEKIFSLDIEEIFDRYNKNYDLLEKFNLFKTLKEKYQSLKHQLALVIKILNFLNELNIVYTYYKLKIQAEKNLINLRKVQFLVEKLSKISYIIKRYKLKNQLSSLNSEKQNLNLQINSVLDELKKIDVCPVCKQKIQNKELIWSAKMIF